MNATNTNSNEASTENVINGVWLNCGSAVYNDNPNARIVDREEDGLTLIIENAAGAETYDTVRHDQLEDLVEAVEWHLERELDFNPEWDYEVEYVGEIGELVAEVIKTA